MFSVINLFSHWHTGQQFPIICSQGVNASPVWESHLQVFPVISIIANTWQLHSWIFLGKGVCSPQTEEDVAIRVHSEHDVFHSCIMDERSFGVHKKHIGYPDLFYQPSIKSHAFVFVALEWESLILPVMSEIQSHCEVLGFIKNKRRQCLF